MLVNYLVKSVTLSIIIVNVKWLYIIIYLLKVKFLLQSSYLLQYLSIIYAIFTSKKQLTDNCKLDKLSKVMISSPFLFLKCSNTISSVE